MTTKACWRCARAAKGRSLLCRRCHDALAAEGLRWCPHGKHAAPLAAFGHRTYCRECVNAYGRARQAQENEARRARYWSDPAYRERRKQSAMAYWPYRKRTIRVVGRKSRAKVRPNPTMGTPPQGAE